jgi:hypothetical protein
MSYFGDKRIAYSYAKRYYGGIQAYFNFKKLTVFNVTNDENLKEYIEYLNTLDPNTYLFDDVTPKTLIKYVKVKYGYGINKYE